MPDTRHTGTAMTSGGGSVVGRPSMDVSWRLPAGENGTAVATVLAHWGDLFDVVAHGDEAFTDHMLVDWTLSGPAAAVGCGKAGRRMSVRRVTMNGVARLGVGIALVGRRAEMTALGAAILGALAALAWTCFQVSTSRSSP
jgi:hypothetical protein